MLLTKRAWRRCVLETGHAPCPDDEEFKHEMSLQFRICTYRWWFITTSNHASVPRSTRTKWCLRGNSDASSKQAVKRNTRQVTINNAVLVVISHGSKITVVEVIKTITSVALFIACKKSLRILQTFSPKQILANHRPVAVQLSKDHWSSAFLDIFHALDCSPGIFFIDFFLL